MRSVLALLTSTSAIPSTIIPLVLGLSACADANMGADTNTCKRQASEGNQGTLQMVEPGIFSTGPVIITNKKRSGGSNLDPGAANMAACLHNDDIGKPPQIHDLQKIGATLSFDIEFRL